jgi:hypothetical protein
MYSYNCTAYRFSDTLSAALPLVKQYGLRGMPHWRWYAKSGAVRSSILLQPAKLHRNGLASSPHLRGEASFAGFLKALHVENVDRSLEEVWNAARGGAAQASELIPKQVGIRGLFQADVMTGVEITTCYVYLVLRLGTLYGVDFFLFLFSF